MPVLIVIVASLGCRSLRMTVRRYPSFTRSSERPVARNQAPGRDLPAVSYSSELSASHGIGEPEALAKHAEGLPILPIRHSTEAVAEMPIGAV